MNIRKLKTFAGSQINGVIAEAIRDAKDEIVEFEFNGVTVQVAADSDPNLIYRDWLRGMLRDSNGSFVVSPYPPKELSQSDLEEDKKLKDAIEKRRAQRQAEYEAEQAKKKAAFEEAVQNQQIELTDPDKWKHIVEINSKDGYSAACVRFAENWARLMQVELASGKQLADIAEKTSFAADTEGITGFMYGAAVSMLSECWKHGEELRRWHNLDTQIKDEGEKANASGGVLNPALLNIGI